jgi:tRNA dimethylallyltransferase
MVKLYLPTHAKSTADSILVAVKQQSVKCVAFPTHLLDVANPKARFTVAQYKQLTDRAIRDIVKRGKTPILCGGTGFYIQAIISGIVIPEVPPNEELRKKLEEKTPEQLFKILAKLDPRRAAEIDAQNPRRLIRAIEIAKVLGAVPPLAHIEPPYDVLQIGISVEQKILEQKIAKRLAARMKKGMLAEGRRLHNEGLSWKRMRALGLEYRMLADILTETTPRKEAEQQLLFDIGNYAKKQMMWFKRDETIKWFKAKEMAKIFKEIKIFL